MSSPWSRALVTGASSGIGRAIALRLGDAGTPLVVVARDTGRLEELAGELRGRHGVDCEVLTADLAVPADRLRVERRLASGPTIDLLVNNAGFGTYGRFATLDPDVEEREVMVNAVAPMRLARAVAPAMAAAGRGWILNVSSMASLQPTPLNATYGSTKAFLTGFSESLHEEMRPSGVVVTAVLPGFTRTEFQERAGLGASGGVPGFMWQSAEDCAEAALTATAAGRALVVPGALNKVTASVAAPLPRALKRRVVGALSGRFKT